MPRNNNKPGPGLKNGGGGDQSLQKQGHQGGNQQIPPSTSTQNTLNCQNGVITNSNTQELLGQARNVLYDQSQGSINNMENGNGNGSGCVYPYQYPNINPNINPNIQLQNRTGQGLKHNQNASIGLGQQYSQVNQPISHYQYASTGTQLHTGQTAECGIPPWATALSQQINNLHSAIENQNSKWQNMTSSINTQNERLTKIETQLSEVNKVKATVAKTSVEVNDIHAEVRTLKTKISDFDSSVQSYSDICEDITGANSGYEIRLNQLERRLNDIERQQGDIQERQDRTDERSIDTQWRTMRENLIFSGIPEVDEENFRKNGEDCEQKVKTILTEVMKVEKEISFDRVHRIGRYNRNHRYPRPIVAKFTFYKDKEYIKQIASTALEGTDYFIKEQFPSEIEAERKLLYGPAREARANKENKVRLVKNKLFINGKRFIPSEQTNKQSESESIRQNQSSLQSNRSNKNRNASNDNPFRWSRTFTRSHQAQTIKEPDYPIQLRNAFASLDSETRENKGTPTRQTHAGKKKATSPLENADSFKKHKEDDLSNSDSDTSTSTVYINDSQMETQPPEPNQQEDQEQDPVQNSSQTS